MAFLIGGANSAADTAFSVDNSCRWNRADTPYMHQTFSGAGNRDKWTFSCWVKKCSNGVEQRLLTTSDNSTYDDNIRFNSDDTFNVICNSATVLKTNRLFRDNSAFYHICVIWDSGNGTSGNRCLLYVNGIRETSFATESYPSADVDSHINNNTPHYIGVTNATADSHHLHGYLAEVVFQNDNADSPVDKFGEFDSDSPTIFKPIDVSGLTLGTNGTYLDFEDSSNLGNDIGGGTDWTEVNFAATDQATDTPTNNFCTMNPLDNYYGGATFSEGNCIVATSTSTSVYPFVTSTFGLTAGKWYFEVEAITVGGEHEIGIVGTNATATNHYLSLKGIGYNSANGKVYKDNTELWTGNTYAADDVIGVAIDLDNLKCYFAKNGTWENSGDPTSGATGTGAASITAVGSTVAGAYFIGFGQQGGGGGVSSRFNFGSPPTGFAIASGNADANSYGNFEYAPPSGYLAICTKNLGSDGG